MYLLLGENRVGSTSIRTEGQNMLVTFLYNFRHSLKGSIYIFVPDELKDELSAGEILALLSAVMIDRASQGRLKVLRFGISKR
jgi:sorbitol-specific phosphotransferase system component IIA